MSLNKSKYVNLDIINEYIMTLQKQSNNNDWKAELSYHDQIQNETPPQLIISEKEMNNRIKEEEIAYITKEEVKALLI